MRKIPIILVTTSIKWDFRHFFFIDLEMMMMMMRRQFLFKFILIRGNEMNEMKNKNNNFSEFEICDLHMYARCDI